MWGVGYEPDKMRLDSTHMGKKLSSLINNEEGNVFSQFKPQMCNKLHWTFTDTFNLPGEKNCSCIFLLFSTVWLTL